MNADVVQGENNIVKIEKARNKIGNALIYACFFLYASSMAAKGVFSAEIKYLVDLWSLDYAYASMANTFYFIAYGLVQVFLFVFMSKIKMKRYLIITVPIAGVFTMLMGLATGIEHIWLIYGLSGALQAGIFCGCNFILTRYLPKKLLSKANILLNSAYAVGTVVAYAVTALFLGSNLWQIPYYIIGVVFIFPVLTFALALKPASRFRNVNIKLDAKRVIDKNKQIDEQPIINIQTKKRKIVFYAIDLTMSFFITALFYGVMNYVTSLMVEVYGMQQDVSVYVSIIAPVAILLGPIMAIKACDRDKNFIRQGIIFTAIMIPIALLMVFLYNANIILALLLTIAYIVLANGIKAIVLSVMTFKLRTVINAGSYSAIANAVASVSAGVTPTIIGAVRDVSGWQSAYLVVLGLTAFVTLALTAINVVVIRDNKKTKTSLK
jgi:sugar phosphate permease